MAINPKTYIEIPADKLREAIKAAYDLSQPIGLGFLHAKGGELDEESVDEIISRERGWIVASMDYVHGRQCKFHVYSDEGNPPRYFVRHYWYDHGEYQLVDLLTRIGVDNPQEKIDAAKAEQEAENAAYEAAHAASSA